MICRIFMCRMSCWCNLSTRSSQTYLNETLLSDTVRECLHHTTCPACSKQNCERTDTATVNHSVWNYWQLRLLAAVITDSEHASYKTSAVGLKQSPGYVSTHSSTFQVLFSVCLSQSCLLIIEVCSVYSAALEMFPELKHSLSGKVRWFMRGKAVKSIDGCLRRKE